MSAGPVSGAFATGRRKASGERYTCIERLGQGGMGVVWRAHDAVLHRDVALKTIPLDAPDDHRARLEQEARVVASLPTAGVVTVHDRGTLQDGRPFLVMELLDVPAMGRGRQTDLHTLLAVARAIGAAHQAGMVHRDLKPSNIGLRGDVPVVMDWGLAKPIDEAWNHTILTATSPQTTTGVGMGSMGYMAPEQVSGQGADARSDVWSLAAMLHEILTGRPPHAAGAHTLLADVVSNRVQLPPGPVSEVARRGLALAPADRFGDAIAFADALEGALTPEVAPERTARWPLWSALLLGGLSLGLAASLRPAPPPLDATSALVEAGWLLARQGRFAEARVRGQQALQHADAPAARGLTLLPAPPDPVAFDFPCEVLSIDPEAARVLCRTASAVELRDLDGTVLWWHTIADLKWSEVRGGRTVLGDGWTLMGIEEDGSTAWSHPVRTPASVLWHDDEVVFVQGHKATWLMHDGVIQTATRLTPPARHHTAMTPTGHTLLLNPASTALFGPEDATPLPLIFDEPLRASRVVGDTLILVGLRGTRLEVDAHTFAEVGRVHLQGLTQVHHVAIDEEGRVAAGTDHGVVVFEGSRAVAQLPDVLVSDLSLRHGQVIYTEDHALRRWAIPAGHTAAPHEASTTALVGVAGAARIAVGQHIYALDPSAMRPHLVGQVPDGPIRSLAGTDVVTSSMQAHHLRKGQLSLIGPLPVIAAFASGQLVGAHRWGAGVAFVQDDGLAWLEDTPVVHDLVTAYGGTEILATTQDGHVWSIAEDRTLTLLPHEDVDRLASGPAGLVVSRQRQVELPNGTTWQAPDVVSRLAVSDRIAVGTVAGDVFVLSAQGEVLLEIRAHGERISALDFVGTDLLTGSWEPGIWRWDLTALRP